MHIERLATIDDSRLAPYCNLHQTNLTRGSGLFIAEGRWLVERLLASNFKTASLLVEERSLQGLALQVPDSVPVYIVPDGEVERVVGFNFHRGILACGRRRVGPPLGSLVPEPVSTMHQSRQHGSPFTIVVAADIQDPTNLCGLLRNCAAFGVNAVLLSSKCADPFSRRVLRVSMGAVLRLAICDSTDLAADLEFLQERGITLAATVLDERAESLETVTRPERLAILFGNEAHGLDAELVARCDRRLTLPMPAGFDSLNVAVASGIFLYYLRAPGTTSQGSGVSRESTQ